MRAVLVLHVLRWWFMHFTFIVPAPYQCVVCGYTVLPVGHCSTVVSSIQRPTPSITSQTPRQVWNIRTSSTNIHRCRLKYPVHKYIHAWCNKHPWIYYTVLMYKHVGSVCCTVWGSVSAHKLQLHAIDVATYSMHTYGHTSAATV